MNSDLLRQIAEQIDQHPEQYNQKWFVTETECGTAYCVAGWACVIDRANGGIHDFDDDMWERAKGLLDISDDEAYILFENNQGPTGDLSIGDALRKIAEVGYVSTDYWDEIGSPSELMDYYTRLIAKGLDSGKHSSTVSNSVDGDERNVYVLESVE
jgi:hypothetical protein